MKLRAYYLELHKNTTIQYANKCKNEKPAYIVLKIYEGRDSVSVIGCVLQGGGAC